MKTFLAPCAGARVKSALEQPAAGEVWNGRSHPQGGPLGDDEAAAANETVAAHVVAAPHHTRGVNLFEKVIRNRSDHDALAIAHEAAVVLPPRSAFLMSDIKRMAPLLQGAAPPLKGVSDLVMLRGSKVRSEPRS